MIAPNTGTCLEHPCETVLREGFGDTTEDCLT